MNDNELIETKIVDNIPTINARNKEVDVPDKVPFSYDLLGRAKYANNLNKIILSYKGGAVLAINGEWGSGKTKFVEMWGKHLQSVGYPVVYYNAWENDISEEPLLSMIKSLKSLSKDGSFDVFVKKAGKFIAGALFGAAKSASGYWGKIVSGAFKGGVEKLEKDCIDSLKSKKDTNSLMKDFKKALIDYLASCDKKIPLIYFVDELDRCNPTFAVKVLERIKHFFEVPNVVFVLSVDKKQLAYSINGYFGSDRIDSTEYLRRFIDIEYSLPKPDYRLFCEHLYDNSGFDIKFEKDANLSIRARSAVTQIAEKFAEFYRLNLRQIEKMFTIARAGIMDMRVSKVEDLTILFFFAYLRLFEIDLYSDIDEYALELQEVIDRLESLIKDRKDGTILREKTFMRTMAYIIVLYMNGLKKAGRYVSPDSLIGDDGKLKVTFRRFDDTIMKESFLVALKDSDSIFNDIEYYKKHISLHERINSYS